MSSAFFTPKENNSEKSPSRWHVVLAYQQPQRDILDRTDKQLQHFLRVVRREEAGQLRYVHFGALLQSLRDRIEYTQEQLVEAVAPAFRDAHVEELSVKTYGNLERDERYPRYQELWVLFRGLAECCQVQFTLQDCLDYCLLARQKANRSKKYARPAADWLALERRIAEYMGVPILQDGQEQEQEERRRMLSQLDQDTSHIIGRDAWLERMDLYLKQKETTRKKIILIQAPLGAGKTSCLKLLQKRLLTEDNDIRVIFHECKKPVDEPSHKEKTAEEHLVILLAHILNDLQPQQAERYEAPHIKERIRLVLGAIGAVPTPVAVLIDDAHVFLDEQYGELSSGWQHFLSEVIEHTHQATFVITTRAWPGWSERKDSYLVQTDLETLSPEECLRIWQNLGFLDEREDILRKAAELCGYNPRMMEIIAQNVAKPVYTFGWSRRCEMMDKEQQGLAHFVEDPHFLSKAMMDAYPLIDEIVTTRLSSEARHLLATLAVSPLPLPAPLLVHFSNHPQRCIKELMRVSLLARDPDRLRLLPLVSESLLQQLSPQERAGIEEHLMGAYRHWMLDGSYRDKQEQAAVIAELAILYLKHNQLLEAAELVIGYGWLLFTGGHAGRIARFSDASMRSLQRYSVEDEAGGLLLRLRLKRFFKDWTESQHKQAYAQLYETMHQSGVQFKPRTILYIIHHQLRYLVGQKRYSEAYSLIKEKCNRHADLRKNDPITYIELLDRQAYVVGRWGDYLNGNGEQRQAFQLRQEAVTIHLQCVDQLRRYEYFAPPLLQSYILYRKARMLHDLSFYERLIGDEQAMIHIEECLSLKEAGYSVQGSLAVTYDYYAYLLAEQGKYQQALFYSDRALQITQRMVDIKLAAASSQMGMLLITRGMILLQLKRFDEAQTLFETGKLLVDGTSRHDLPFPEAVKGLRSIEEQRRVNPHGYLDHQWFSRYEALVFYSDVKWLTPAGPFTVEEQEEWERLSERKDKVAQNRLAEIIAQTQERELALSFKEAREPQFYYPLIPLREIEEKRAELARLRAEIETTEENMIVRQLYLGAIDERTNELGMIAATGKQDDEAFWTYSQQLYALPTLQEMELAIRPLTRLLHKGLQNTATSGLALQLIRQTQHWLIDPMRLEEREQESEQENEEQSPSIAKTRRYFSSETVQRFFENVFQRYQFTWTVVRDPSTLHPRISLSEKQLILPGGEQLISTTKIREMLAHEIEMHVFRSVAGEKSRLQLLSLGLANFLETEEGLALYYSQEAARFGATKPNKTWTGTLAVGLAAGVVCRPYSFNTLHSFLRDVFVLRDRLANKKTEDEIQEDALKNAQKRCLRTWRGVSHLMRPGICATKDCVYLRGYLAACDRLQQEPAVFTRLLAGSVSLRHLDALSELGITAPHVAHQRLACDPDLESYIMKFTNKDTSE